MSKSIQIELVDVYNTDLIIVPLYDGKLSL